MNILIILIGTVIGAVIGWRIPSLMSTGEFRNLDIDKDGNVQLEFVYRKRLGVINDTAKTELADFIKTNSKGLSEITVCANDRKKLIIYLKFEKTEGEAFIFNLKYQQEALTYLCNGF